MLFSVSNIPDRAKQSNKNISFLCSFGSKEPRNIIDELNWIALASIEVANVIYQMTSITSTTVQLLQSS
jgi:hypothetical protein